MDELKIPALVLHGGLPALVPRKSLPALLLRGGLPAHLPESTPGQTLTGKQESAVSGGCSLAGAVQMKSLEVEAGKMERRVTWAGCGHRLHNVPKHLPEMLGSFHSHGAWIAPCFLLSVTIAKALQVKIDLRSVLKLPETWYFLPGGIRVPLSIACQCKTEAAMFTKLTNGLQVKHWAICAAAFFFPSVDQSPEITCRWMFCYSFWTDLF